MLLAIPVSSGVTAPRDVRHQVRERLRGALDERTVTDLELLLSEVVTNAVRYAGADGPSEIDVRIQIGDEIIAVEVADKGSGFARPATPKPRFERNPGGFGLFMLDLLSSRWGVERTETGFRVWFKLSRTRSDRPA